MSKGWWLAIRSTPTAKASAPTANALQRSRAQDRRATFGSKGDTKNARVK
jgi:hypothetical protein